MDPGRIVLVVASFLFVLAVVLAIISINILHELPFFEDEHDNDQNSCRLKLTPKLSVLILSCFYSFF